MLPEKVTQFIGRKGDVSIYEVEKGAIKKFADAVGDRNQLYWDEEYARNSRFRNIVAPPGFFGWPVKWHRAIPFFSELRQELVDAIAGVGFKRILDGGIEFDFFQPVHAGDILTSVLGITSIDEREGKSGKMILSLMETTYINQGGAVVAKARQTLIHR